MIRFMPTLKVFSGIPRKENVRSQFADPANKILDDCLAIFEFEQTVIVPRNSLENPFRAPSAILEKIAGRALTT